MTGNSAINILLDVVFTIQGTTGGDNGVTSGRSTSGSAVTFKADRVSIAGIQRTLADHSTAQDGPELNRVTKEPQSATIETKVEKKASAPLKGLLASSAGVVVIFTATATGSVVTAQYAIVENVEWDYDGPSTLRFTLRQYGTAWTIANT